MIVHLTKNRPKYNNKNGTPHLVICNDSRARGNAIKLVKNRTRYDTTKHFFTERILNGIVYQHMYLLKSSSVNVFKNRLGVHVSKQDIFYNYHAAIMSTGSRGFEQYYHVFCSIL